MALKCCGCSEILMDNEEAAVLDYTETFFESSGRLYRHTFVSSGYCPDCFDGLINEATMARELQAAA